MLQAVEVEGGVMAVDVDLEEVAEVEAGDGEGTGGTIGLIK